MKKLLVLLASIFVITGCNLKAKAEADIKKVEVKLGADFCLAAKKFVPMGASAMAKQYSCTKAQECLQGLPEINKCFSDNTLRASATDMMAAAKVVCVPVVQLLAAEGSKYVADKCACDQTKLEKDMLQALALCSAI